MHRTILALPLWLAACHFSASESTPDPAQDPADGGGWGAPVTEVPAFSETLAGPPPVLSVGTVVRGEPLTLTVTGAPPGAQLRFYGSVVGPAPGGLCNPSPRVCLDINPAFGLGIATVDASRTGSVTVMVPDNVPFPQVWFQVMGFFGTQGGKLPVVVRDISDPDTFTPADSDTSPDTDPPVPGATNTTPMNVHAGIHAPGQLLAMRRLVVTGVRFRAIPPASNSFTAQDPTSPTNAGITVFVGSSTTLPIPGDEVAVLGTYEEFPSGTASSGLSRLVALPGDPLANVVVTRQNRTIPPPVPLTLAEFTAGPPEAYESMLVTLDDPGVYTVNANPNASTGTFPLVISGAPEVVTVDPEQFDLRTTYGVTAGDTVDSLRGVVRQVGTSYRITATTQADAAGYVDN